MTSQQPPSLRDRIAQALRDAAHDCDDTCGLTERDCVERHPIQVSVYHHDVIAGVYGYIDALADTVLPVVQAEIAAARDAALTEAAEMLRHAVGSPNETDGLDAAADLLDAARTPTSPAGCTDCGGRTYVHPGHYPTCPTRTKTS